MNHLVGQKIAITSDKPQTTRNRIQAIYSGDEGQIIFIDTPGIHKVKNKLGEYMVTAAERTLREVDLILWLVEPSTFIGAGERHIVEQLSRVKTPVFLVINKVDTVKKEKILTYIDAYKGLLDFAEIIPVSALKGANTDQLLSAIFKYLPVGPMYYDEDTITDQPEKQIAAELIREKALMLLEEEVPHGIAVVIESMKERQRRINNGGGSAHEQEAPDNTIIDIDAVIICDKDSHKGIIIGKNGSMLKQIGTLARKEIEDLLDCRINLKLWVKVKRDWRDSEFLLYNYGYNKNEL
jgi:GTP-binding protein Era